MAQLTTLGFTILESFDNLVLSGTSAELPGDWAILERGTSTANDGLVRANNGGTGNGNTYSYGLSGSSDRALGMIKTATFNSTFGSSFTNDTGQTITALEISYIGEQWRLGASGRGEDRLDFQISFDATSLSTGTWMDIDELDFSSPVTEGTVGALNGNLAANSTLVSATIGGLSIAAGATFWIRFTDFEAAGADDGLAVDNFAITAQGEVYTPQLSIADASVSEGDTDTRVLTFTVSLNAATTVDITFDIATADGTALAGSDYIANALTGLTIAAGETSATFEVIINGDADFEASETFLVDVTNVAGAVVFDGQAMGLIENDDASPEPVSQNGGNGADMLFGLPGTIDIIAGNAGNDTIYGYEMDDFLLGGAGNDTVWGGDDNDIVYGGAGNDLLYGEAGNDRIAGDKGTDTLSGGTGADVFLFTRRFGQDTITDFEDGVDQLQFAKNVFANTAAVLSSASQVGDDVVIQTALGDTVTLLNFLLSNLDASDIIIA